MTAERKPGEREKCHKIHCPNHPAWIPAGQNGCPHCAGTATRGYCVCEMASADEIRDMYTPPAPETPPCPYGEDADCAFHSHPAPETPSPEVGIRERAHLIIDQQIDKWLDRRWEAESPSPKWLHHAEAELDQAASNFGEAVAILIAAAKEQSK